MQPSWDWVSAHSCGKFSQALTLYQKYWNSSEKAIQQKTFRNAAIANFKEMAEKQLTHPDLPKLKKALGLTP